ncbi:nucleotidyltransferase family protein [Parapedobacter sp. DT-150]|uniref:nucleotidyltransferase family protein n=1 Tax=Parapedobacter sp. DT-150 TaxID=3396162 RepID=UPI003F1A24EE
MGEPVQSKEGVISLLRANRSELRRYGVLKLSLFGSFLTNRFNPNSDVDFLVEFRPEMKTYDNFMELSFFLEDLLGRKVELVTPQSLSPYIGPHILSQAEYVAL